MNGVPHRRRELDGPMQFAPRRIRDQPSSLVDDIVQLDAGGIRTASQPRPTVDPDHVVELERDLFDALHNAGRHRFGTGASTDLNPSRWLRKSLALGIGGVALAAVLWTAWPTIEGAASFMSAGDHTATAAVDTKPMPTPPLQATSINTPLSVIGVTPTAPDTKLGQGTVQPTWTAPPPPPARTTQERTTAAPPTKEIRRVAPDDLAVLIRRGEEILKTGDTSAARLLLERAAEAGSARAAFVIGTSYEKPSPGRRAADTETARTWFQRAADLGSPEAQQRLGASAAAAPR
jgi:hypothetical protein